MSVKLLQQRQASEDLTDLADLTGAPTVSHPDKWYNHQAWVISLAEMRYFDKETRAINKVK